MKVSLLGLWLLWCVFAHFSTGHDHSHGHSHDEDPSFKWSLAANIVEDEIMDDDIVDITPQYVQKDHYLNDDKHSHGGHHGHSHGGHHGHSHGGHHGHSHGGHHGHSHDNREPTASERLKMREKLFREWDDDEDDRLYEYRYNIWLNALGSTLAISVAPFVILFFFNLDNSEEKCGLLKIALAFASGGLLGDAFLHLIPHALMAQDGHSHSHGHSHSGDVHESHDNTVGLGVLGGIFAFMVVEKSVRILSDGHGHSHHSAPSKIVEKKMDASKDKQDKDGKSSVEDEKMEKEEKDEDKEEKDEDKEEKDEDKEEKKKKKDEKHKEGGGSVQVAGYLNLFADFFHNFTDGLAIGSSFLAGNSIGWLTTFTILFHEIPHEIGDYAILIQSGVKPFKAKCLQLLTAVGAFAGCVVSLLAEGATSGTERVASAFILPFTAGGFIYIATVSVIPELLEGKSSVTQSFLEIVALLVGVAMMVVITWFE